ncbi:MAG: DUF3047 domain-containing protein [Deltaproteobacteria bacterium]|nr:DUF3047 domain-containing protein [Deltaproteobacteria bacterium]
MFEYASGKLSVSENLKYAIVKVLYGEYPPLSTINYIWSSKHRKG